jgi:hypothetical protein
MDSEVKNILSIILDKYKTNLSFLLKQNDIILIKVHLINEHLIFGIDWLLCSLKIPLTYKDGNKLIDILKSNELIFNESDEYLSKTNNINTIIESFKVKISILEKILK